MEFGSIFWLVAIGGFFYFMMKSGGGCCGSHDHGGHGHGGNGEHGHGGHATGDTTRGGTRSESIAGGGTIAEGEPVVSAEAAVVDPVCGMEVASDDLTGEYLVRTFRFCSEKCRNLFQLNPYRYTKRR